MITCVCAFVGFIYGIVKFFKPKKAIYAQMITLSVGCMAFGRLYQVVRLITVGDMLEHFQLGVLGVIGSLLFLFSANFGVMDSLADDGSKQFLKYRLIALITPVAAISVYLSLFLFSDFPLLVKIVSGIITAVASCASYYNLKHLIFPDVDFGVIKCLKSYNILAIAFDFLCVAEIVAYGLENNVAILIIGVAISAVMVAMTPVVERGIKKWTT